MINTHRFTERLCEDFVAKFEKWVVYDQVDHAEDIFFGKTFVLLALEPSSRLDCYLDVFVVSSFESFVNDFLEPFLKLLARS